MHAGLLNEKENRDGKGSPRMAISVGVADTSVKYRRCQGDGRIASLPR